MSLRNKTIAEALREGKKRLQRAGKEAYAVEAELLLEKAVGLNRTALFLRGEEPLSAEAAMQYEGFLAERESGRRRSISSVHGSLWTSLFVWARVC